MVMGNVIQLKDKCPYFEGPKNIKIPAGIPKFMPEMTVGNLPVSSMGRRYKANLLCHRCDHISWNITIIINVFSNIV